MSGANYQILVKNVMGQEIAVLSDFLTLDMTRSVGNIGELMLSIPYNHYPSSYFPTDGIIEVWRSKASSPTIYLEGETIWFVRNSCLKLTEGGIWSSEIYAHDAVDLLDRRIIAYADKSAQAVKTDLADDMIKSYVSENSGSAATNSARSLATYLSIQPNLSAGPSLSKAASYRSLLTTLQEISAASFILGTYLAFDVVSLVPASGIALEFRTYTGQRGTDHRWGISNLPVVLDPQASTISELEMSWDSRELKNCIYAGGKGQGEDKIISPAIKDDISIALSPFNRCEYYHDAINADTISQAENAAAEQLRLLRARRTFSCRTMDTDYVQYGVHYGFGDFVTANVLGTKVDCRVDAVNIHVEGGTEQVNVLLRSDD